MQFITIQCKEEWRLFLLIRKLKTTRKAETKRAVKDFLKMHIEMGFVKDLFLPQILLLEKNNSDLIQASTAFIIYAN